MQEVFTLTFANVCKMLLFISCGFLLYKSGRLPKDSPKVLSTVTTMLFYPAYTINNLSHNFTIDKVGEKSLILLLGLACLAASIGLAFLLGKLLGKNHLDRRTLVYTYTVPNYAYFGYPIIEAVFGPSLLADVIVFTIPFAITANTFGYWLFAGKGENLWKRMLTSPIVWSPFIGVALGLSGITLPSVVTNVLSSAGGCMSPVSMLVVGFVLGHMRLRELVSSIRAYFLSLIRMVAIPALFGVVLYFCGLRQAFLLIPLLVLSMPIGVNIVVFPESNGMDASDNAKLLFVSYVLALVVLPATFSLISQVAGM